MDASIYVTPPLVRLPDPTPPPPPTDVGDLLRQVLDVQKEQLAVLKCQAAAQDASSRWRAFLARWENDFPEIGNSCKEVLPIVERAYLSLIQDLTERLQDSESDWLDSDFALGEFLDRYGMRLGQLGTILSQLGPLADAAPVNDGNGNAS